MLGKIFKLIVFILAAVVAYLLFWPVPVDPVAWKAPKNKGYVGDFVPNDKLASIELLDIGDHNGPEDVVIDGNGFIYTAVTEGRIIKINPETGKPSVFAETGGRPLGMEFDAKGNLIVADAFIGLLQISTDGKVTVLTDKADDGTPLAYADDLDITPDGKIYFSDASTKFGAREFGGGYKASLLDLMEHGSNGRVLRFDPGTGMTETILKGLNFTNGIAADPAGNFILIVETGSYRVSKYWLKGEKTGTTEIIIENLPGFPDNINRGSNGTYWLGLVSPRSAALDGLSNWPLVRKMVQRLPTMMRPKAQYYGLVVNINADGEVLETLQDPSGKIYSLTTGALEGPDGLLYVTSLDEDKLGRVKH